MWLRVLPVNARRLTCIIAEPEIIRMDRFEAMRGRTADGVRVPLPDAAGSVSGAAADGG
jgi:hypothetical protein